MGTWDATVFGNDDAADWADILVNADLEQLVADALERATGSAGAEYLRYSKGVQALAAAEIVAAAAGAPTDANAYNERALEWASGRARLASLTPVAIRAVDRVVADDSELAELWAEGDETAWLKTTDDLRERLRSRAEAG
ncbi:hypothetical protein GCM10029976_039070 [Kribbella albertanoniae]|uniref:DUF4259 domain-containing protein n=1 Tax=Kribbella albertanoniae TaxID=1266829 RepID=A0A4R4QAI9_9ACTN|nr:DUF4259 domain-containing protein [Kribbella albertanoniae]TDC32327.1 DUF4259 domain-containing protein [Kribbella albertanoniae]